MSLKLMRRDIIQRKSINAFEKYQSTEEIDMETEQCKNDYPKLDPSISNSYMQDQITEKKSGNVATLHLALDLNKVNRIKQKQQ